MIRHDGWSHMIVTLMTCVSTLCNALILLAIEIAILFGASTRWWMNLREGEHRRKSRRWRKEKGNRPWQKGSATAAFFLD